MRVAILTAGAVLALSAACPASAADLSVAPIYKAPSAVWVPSWFVEGRVGAAFGRFDDLRFLNPVGAVAAVNPSGNFILLDNKALTDTSWTGGVSVGYFFTNNLFGKVSYQYLGSFSASGFAAFTGPPVTSFRQDLTTSAHALLVGLGVDYNITDALFLEAIGELGVGFLRSTGVQGANLGTPVSFPSASNTNFVAGAGIGLGYHLTRNFDLMVNGNYYWLGKADTGITGTPPPVGMNTGEQLQAKLGVFTLTVGGRARF